MLGVNLMQLTMSINAIYVVQAAAVAALAAASFMGTASADAQLDAAIR